MKNKFSIIGILLLLVGASAASGYQVNFNPELLGRGNWFYVGGSGPGNYTTIQDAIDKAGDGDTVFVYQGTYLGYVVINKRISLLGEDKNNTCILGYFAYAVSLVHDGVTLRGFTIKNQGRLGEGIRIDSNNNSVSDTIIDMPGDRIRIAGDNNTISCNTITNCYMYLSGEYNKITGNSITNNDYALFLMDAWENIILENSLKGAGLFISMGNICKNDIRNNSVNGKPLLYFDDESDLLLDDDVGQIILINCTNITVQHQNISNTTAGVQIFDSTACTLVDSRLADNYFGVCLTGSNNHITHTTLTDNEFGMYVSGENNTFSENIYHGNDICLYLILSHHTTICLNTFEHNTIGILLDFGCIFNVLINNTLTINTQGIGISGESNTVIGNNITGIVESIGVSVSGDANILTENVISQNYIGIQVSSDKNSFIRNTINGNSCGIVALNGQYNNITKNIINENDEAILLVSSRQNSIMANTIASNHLYGIHLVNDSFNTIMGNIITQNIDAGFLLNGSTDNLLSGNEISYNRKGIHLISAANNAIYANNFLKNKRHGLFDNCSNEWMRNYWGRPRLLPKLIVGTIKVYSKEFFCCDIDWHPARQPYDL